VPIAGDDDHQPDAAPLGEAGDDVAQAGEVSEAAVAEVTEDALGAVAETIDEPGEDGSEPGVDDAAERHAVEEPPLPKSSTPRAPRGGGRPAAPRRTGSGAAGGRDRRTTAQRLGNFPRADRPENIPSPEHHHLPGWVRRDFARARPPLSNILALLEGEVHDQFAQRIAELTEGISSGKFSLAWQYPDLVDEGRTLYDKQRREGADAARANRQLDTARRRVQDRIRDAADALSPEVSARLQRTLRSATDAEAIATVTAELDGVLSTARSSADKRREREIERTKARIRRSAAAAGVAAAPEPQTETWQDVLRRFAEQQQAAGSRSSE